MQKNHFNSLYKRNLFPHRKLSSIAFGVFYALMFFGCSSTISPKEKQHLNETVRQAEQAEAKLKQLQGEKEQLEAELAREKESLEEYDA